MSSKARRLAAKPVLLQDWAEEGGERAAQYWELFLDLVLVAAASNVADGFKETQNMAGFATFCTIFMIYSFGWYFYTHMQTRFEDNSLMHSLLLFWFLLGMAAAVVNTDGFEQSTVRAFAMSNALQRLALGIMLLPVAAFHPRARRFVAMCETFCGIDIACFVASAAYGTPEAARAAWSLSAVLSFFFEAVVAFSLPGAHLVPINIEHSSDRMGCFILVMLGETVVSATINYRTLGAHGSSSHLYTAMALTFLLIFSFTLLFFHMQPPRELHAFHRSRLHGVSMVLAYKVLGMSLLAVGVCTKVVVESTVATSPMPEFTSWLFGLSVGCSLLVLLWMRCLHYWGRFPGPMHAEGPARLMRLWWLVFGLVAVLPFGACAALRWAGVSDPLTAVGVYSGLVAFLCVVESGFTHLLGDHLDVSKIDAGTFHDPDHMHTHHGGRAGAEDGNGLTAPTETAGLTESLLPPRSNSS